MRVMVAAPTSEYAELINAVQAASSVNTLVFFRDFPRLYWFPEMIVA